MKWLTDISRANPLDDKGYVHVGMVRLEVEAEKSCQENI